jgi:hypothetical protein
VGVGVGTGVGVGAKDKFFELAIVVVHSSIANPCT